MRVVLLAAISFAMSIAGCGTQRMPQSQQSTVTSTEGSTMVQTAQVTDVRDRTVRGGRSPGIASVVGGVLGAVAGSNIGGGYGRTAAVVGGTVAGSVAGQQIERSRATSSVTEVTVRFANGDERTFSVDPNESFRIGDTVKVTTHQGNIRITH